MSVRFRILVLTILGVLIVVASPVVGERLSEGAGSFILWQLRVPRVLMAVLVGATLSLVGAVYQTILANPLAAPSTVGTTAGATLGALIAVTFGAASTLAGLPLVVVFAFAGAMAVTLLLTAIAASGRARLNDVLLMGVAISLAAGAISAGIQYTADSASLMAAVQWSLGHLPQVGYRGVLLLAPFAIAAILALLFQTRALEALLGGEERAHSQGVDVPRLRALALGAGALGVSACVAWCGPIAFVGLIVPHIVRLSVGVSRRVLLPMSIVVGAAFLTLCDTGSRLLLPGRELPVGVLTAAIGAPTLVWLVARRRR
jgi:ABC-type Fe3+-siderophore transport system permease subunit